MKKIVHKKWLLLIGLLSLIFLPTMLVLVVSMLPTLAALAVDKTKERYLAMGIGALNFCGCLPAIVILWTEGQSLTVALSILGDVMLWLAPYGASAIGWLIYLSIQPVMASYYAATASQRLEELRSSRAALIEQWGDALAEHDDLERPGLAGSPGSPAAPRDGGEVSQQQVAVR